MGNPYNDMARFYAAQERARVRTMSRRERIEDDLEYEWYTVPEAAKVLRLSTKRVYQLIREGKLEYSQPSPRKTLLHYSDLAQYMSKKGQKNSK
jgi:excisionase family DNA binding protein